MNDEFLTWLTVTKDYLSGHVVFFIIGLAVFALLFFLRVKLSGWISKGAYKALKTWPIMASGVQTSIKDPLRVWFPFLGLYLFLLIINPYGQLATLAYFGSKLIRIANIVLVTWICVNLTPFITSVLVKNSEANNRTNAVAIKFTANVLKVVFFALSFVVIISELGYNINGIITGLGIGGLTLSLAAQNTASNFFAGFEIVSDRPFELGDYIKTPSCEGVIEDMTMRSTRIRTEGDVLVIVPNSTLMQEAVVNYSKMGKRLVSDSVGLAYDTDNETVKKCIDQIEDMLYAHPDVQKERIVVNFDKLSKDSLDINFMYFTSTTDWDDAQKVKEDVNFKIRDIIEQSGAKFAHPTTHVYLEQTDTQV